jgi:hypothetical protein
MGAAEVRAQVWYRLQGTSGGGLALQSSNVRTGYTALAEDDALLRQLLVSGPVAQVRPAELISCEYKEYVPIYRLEIDMWMGLSPTAGNDLFAAECLLDAIRLRLTGKDSIGQISGFSSFSGYSGTAQASTAISLVWSAPEFIRTESPVVAHWVISTEFYGNKN